MPLYMTQFAYAPEAWAALTRSPEDRSEAIGGLLENMGGRLISFYNSFGEYDEDTAAAGVLAAVTPGHIKAIKRRPPCSASKTPWMRCARRARRRTGGRDGSDRGHTDLLSEVRLPLREGAAHPNAVTNGIYRPRLADAPLARMFRYSRLYRELYGTLRARMKPRPNGTS